MSDKIIDADNMPTSIIKYISGTDSNFAKFEINTDYLIVTANSKGETKQTIHANLNGKSVKKRFEWILDNNRFQIIKFKRAIRL